MILERNIKRYLDIITQVYYQKKHKIDKKTLQKSLGISVKTLESDIEKINILLKKELIIQENNQIFLNLKMSDGLKQIYKRIIKTSTVISYFYEVSMYHLTLAEIYNELYLSESMEYRIRKAWNNHFVEKNYAIEFIYNSETKKIDLIGEEDTIRSLMRYMLYEYVFEDIYDNLQYNEIISLVENISKKKKKAMNYVAIDLVSASLYVSFVRIAQGYHRKSKIDPSLKLLQKWLSKEPQILDKIKRYFNIDISLHVLSDLFGGKLQDLIKLVNTKPKKILRKQNTKLISFISAYSSIKYHNTVQLKKNELQLLEGICNFSDFKVSSFVYSPHQLYWEWIATEDDKTLFYDLIDSYSLDLELPTKEKKIEFFFVLNNMLDFDNLEKSVNYTKFLIVSRYPTYYQNRIEHTLNDRYHAFINLTIYKESVNTLNEHILRNYDFVLSELTFPIFSEKHVYFPEVLSEEFISNLDKLIFHF
ncbi:hypothetical protein G8C15_17090 [Enterococcus casseliflavus]|nr:hypothetical protein [Enterococcus casseliflavus]